MRTQREALQKEVDELIRLKEETAGKIAEAEREFEERTKVERLALESTGLAQAKTASELRSKGYGLMVGEQQLEEDRERFSKEMKTVVMVGVIVARLGIKVMGGS